MCNNKAEQVAKSEGIPTARNETSLSNEHWWERDFDGIWNI